MPLASPLHGLPNKRHIWGWISFDVANQSFTLIINTLLFAIFFKEVAASGRTNTDTLWSLVFAGSMLLVVLASPLAGAIADARGTKKIWLLTTGFACGVLTCLLATIQPGMLWLACLLYIPANFCFNLGENFLAAFLPQLAPREHAGRLSAFSWGIAYCAALLMLVLIVLGMAVFGLEATSQWRPFFVGAGLWFIAFAIPTLLFLKEPRIANPATMLGAAGEAASRLARTFREVRTFRDLATLLVASFFYGGAMAVIISFASIIASDFGFQAKQLVIFVAVITVSGIVGTLIPMFLQDSLGHKRMTLALLVLWLGTSLFLAFVSYRHSAGQLSSTWPVWLAGNLLGLGIGSLGSANRAFVGYLTPTSRAAEFFGLWGLVLKLSAVLVIPFGVVKDRLGKPEALLVLTTMVLVGFVLTLFVDERRGVLAAERESEGLASTTI
jgi:UMF1 family MFS transporter